MKKSVSAGLFVIGLAFGLLLPYVVGPGAVVTAQPAIGGGPSLEVGKNYRFAVVGGYQDGIVREVRRDNWVRIEPEPSKATGDVGWVNLAAIGFVFEVPKQKPPGKSG